MADRFYYLGPWQWADAPDEQFWHAPEHTVGLVDLRPLSPVDTFGFFATEQPLVGSDYERFGDGRIADATLSQSDRQKWADMLGLDARPDGPTLLDVLWQTLTMHADPDGGDVCPPLTATHRGIMELHLGGHSLIRSQRFGGVKDPAWPRVQALLQRNYRRITQDAERSARRGEQPTLHRKWLEVQRRKYRVDPRLLVPGDMRFETPLRPTTTIGDTFANTDGTLIENHTATGGDGGFGWTPNNLNNWQINSNQAGTNSSNSSARADSALSSDDHYAQIVATVMSVANDRIGAFARMPTGGISALPDAYVCWFNNTNRLDLFRSSTKLDDASITKSLPDVVRVECDGSTIRGVFNGSTEIEVTDTAVTGNLLTGIFDRNNGGYGDVLMDNFEAADLVADAGAVIPPPVLSMTMRGF